jgi:hypothetical protein
MTFTQAGNWLREIFLVLPRRAYAPSAAVSAVSAAICLAEYLRPTDPWLREVGHVMLTMSIVLGSLSILLAWAYAAGTSIVRTASLRPVRQESLAFDVDAIRSYVDEIYGDIGASRALYFGRMISQPSDVIERISESLDARVSTTSIRSTYTVEVFHDPELDAIDHRGGRRRWWRLDTAPHEAEDEIEMVFPLFLQSKGKLENNLRFLGNDGERISSLTQVSAIGYTAAVMRFLMSYSEDINAFKRYRDQIEPKVVQLLASTASPEGSDPVSLDDVIIEIWDLAKDDPNLSETGSLVVDLLLACSTKFPVCVVYSYGSRKHEVVGRRLRFTVERDSTPGKFATPELKKLWYNKVQEAMRLNLGILPTRFVFLLENAERCGSYHLQIEGPKGTYLGRQAFIDVSTGQPIDPPPSQYVMLGRGGQSMSHLYVRNGVSFGRLQFMNLFYETPPGSLAAATLSSWAAAVLILMSLLKPAGGESQTDMVAALFAFPAILAVWAGFERDPGGVGERLVVRIIRFVSIGLSVAAAFLYVTAGWPTLSKDFQWFILFFAAAINAFCASSTWVLRAKIYRTISRATPEVAAQPE